jgi:DNA-directed RNA polymerase
MATAAPWCLSRARELPSVLANLHETEHSQQLVPENPTCNTAHHHEVLGLVRGGNAQHILLPSLNPYPVDALDGRVLETVPRFPLLWPSSRHLRRAWPLLTALDLANIFTYLE